MLFKYAVAVLSLAVIPILGQYLSTNYCSLQTVQSLSLDLDRVWKHNLLSIILLVNTPKSFQAIGKWFHTTSFEIPDIFRRGDEVWNCTYLELSGNETNGFTAFANLGSKNKTLSVQKPAGTQNGVLTIGSGPLTIPVWVFDTDYSNFAVVMFCGLTLFGHTGKRY